MRNLLLAGPLVSIVSFAAPAYADDINVLGVYDVKYEEVSTNCGENKLAYGHGKLKIEQKGARLFVDVERTPGMYGAPSEGGKISAKSKLGETMLGGMLGTFSVSGRVSADGQLKLVMIGEYSVKGRSLCTQSWNVSGPRSSDKPATPKK